MTVVSTCDGGLVAELIDLLADGLAHALGIDVGLADQPRRLLLGDAQGVLELRAESRVGGVADLVELGLQVFGDRLQTLDLFGLVGLLGVRLDQVAPQFADDRVDFVLLVAPEFGAETRVLRCHVNFPFAGYG